MTDETRAELRRGLEAVVRAATSDSLEAVIDVACRGHDVSVYATTHLSYLAELPPLTTAQQLALSVLLGESVPLSVLLSACEDAGLFPDGVMSAVAEKARLEGWERCERWLRSAGQQVALGGNDDRYANALLTAAHHLASTRSLGE